MGGICKVEGCGNKQLGLGFCNKHYKRFKKHGDPLIVRHEKNNNRDPICSVEGCNGKHDARGYCIKHYHVYMKYGNPIYVIPPKKCKIKDCKNKHEALGYCKKHYTRFKKYGDPNVLKVQRYYGSLCKIEECNKKAEALGYCENHYWKYKKYGDPLYCKIEFHGMHNAPEYQVWSNMKARCYNKNADRYNRYGGRGITVCDRWLHSFISFHKDMGLKLFPEAQIDRIDIDGNYEPDNCRWVTASENMNNRSISKRNR